MEQLTEEQAMVWDILSCPYVCPTIWDDIEIEDIRKIIDACRVTMVDNNVLR